MTDLLKRPKRTGAAVAVALTTAAALIGVTLAGAQVLPPDSYTASDCRGQTPIIVASDETAQSDLYSALTLAAAIDTSCVVLAGARSSPMPSHQSSRLAVAQPRGWVVGGTAAVPSWKVSSQHTRLSGVDRWQTAKLVGSQVTGSLAEEVTTLRGSVEALERRLDAIEGSNVSFPKDSISSIWAQIDLLQNDVTLLKVTNSAVGTSRQTFGSSNVERRLSDVESDVEDMQGGFLWNPYSTRSLYELDRDLDSHSHFGYASNSHSHVDPFSSSFNSHSHTCTNPFSRTSFTCR